MLGEPLSITGDDSTWRPSEPLSRQSADSTSRSSRPRPDVRPSSWPTRRAGVGRKRCRAAVNTGRRPTMMSTPGQPLSADSGGRPTPWPTSTVTPAAANAAAPQTPPPPRW